MEFIKNLTTSLSFSLSLSHTHTPISTSSPHNLHFHLMAIASPKLNLCSAAPSPSGRRKPPSIHHHLVPSKPTCSISISTVCSNRKDTTRCKAADVSVATETDGYNWVPVVPLAALPKGERRVIIQDGETILLLWYKNDVYAIENRSPAEGAYSEGLINAKLTQDGCIVCPTTDSTFDLKTGEIKEWYPKNPVLRALTPPLRLLFVYPAKTDGENIYISMGGVQTDAATEIVFSGKAKPGVTASDVNVDEVRMVIDEDVGGFGFTKRNELINGKAATIGFLLLLDFELLTGEGLLKGTGFLDFIYSISGGVQ